MWSSNDTLIDIFKYLYHSCSHPDANIMIQTGNLCFKTTEAFSYLRKSLGALGLVGNHTLNVTIF